MHPFRDSISFYFRHIEKLLLLSITIVLPFSLLNHMTVNYTDFIAAHSSGTAFADVSGGFFTLLFFMICQLPFVKYVLAQMEGEERPVRQAYRTFFEYGFSVFLFGVTYGLAVFTGLFIFIIPGIVILVLFYLTPYMTVFREEPTGNSYRPALQMAKKHFFPLLGLIFLALFIETSLSLIAQIAVTSFSTKFSAMLLTQLLINLMVFPYFAILTTMFVKKWQESSLADRAEAAV